MTRNTGQSAWRGARHEALIHAQPSTQTLRTTTVDLNNVPFSIPLYSGIRFDLSCVAGRRFSCKLRNQSVCPNFNRFSGSGVRQRDHEVLVFRERVV